MASSLVPLTLGIFGKAKKEANEKIFKLVTLYLLCSVVSDAVSTLFAFQKINNLWIIHLFGLVEMCIFFKILTLNSLSQKKINGFLFVLITLYIFNSIFFEKITKFNGNFHFIISILFILIVLINFYKLYKYEEENFIEENFKFWINIGILFYCSGALFSFILSSEILSGRHSNLSVSWTFHAIAMFIKNLLFAIGLWKARTTH